MQRGIGNSDELRLAETKAIHLAVADLAGFHFFHLVRDKINGTANFLASRLEAISNHRVALVVLPDVLLRLVDNHDLRAWTCYPDHFLDGPHLVGKEVDAAHMEYAVKRLHLERKPLGLRLEQVRTADSTVSRLRWHFRSMPQEISRP